MPDTIVTPVFPLPNLVFFPRTWLPLHIFEPRYVAMVSDAVEGQGVVAMVQLRPRWEKDYAGSPPIYGTATLGKIARHERLEGGRWNVLLYGVKRLRVEQELDKEDKPYRRVRASFIESDEAAGAAQMGEAKNRLLALCHKLIELKPAFEKTLGPVLVEHRRPDVFADLVAGFLSNTFSVGSYERQCILDEAAVVRRLQLINIQAGKIVRELLDGAI